MRMSKRRKNFLHLYCSSGAIAVAVGTLISTAWADQSMNTAALTVVDHASGDGAVSSQAGSGEPLGEDVQQLQQLAKLQQQQIVSQRRALGKVPATAQSRLGLEFLLPSNVAGLQQLIVAQQDIIQQQAGRMTETESLQMAAASDMTADVAQATTDLSQPLVDEPTILTAELPEQDTTAREAFDQALEDSRDRTEVPADVADAGDVTVEVAEAPAVVTVEDDVAVVTEPEVTEVKVAAEWRTPKEGESPVVSIPPRAVAVPAATTEPAAAAEPSAVSEQAAETTVLEMAEAEAEGGSDLDTLRKQLREQSELLERQSRELEEQRQSVEAQKARLEQLERQMAEQSEVQPITVVQQPAPQLREAFFVPPQSLEVPGGGTYTLATDEPPPEVVGEEQGEQAEQRTREISGVEEAGGVLTKAGSFILEPSIQYSQSNVNRFFFQGLEIVDTVLIGNIEATDSDRDSITAEIQARYGFTSRLEASVSVPYVYRNDRVTRQIVSVNTTSTTIIDGKGLGDVEVAGRYQINRAQPGWPIFIANARFKSNTGEGPFEVSRDANGIETELAAGSGFFGFEPGMTMLVRSDPVVFFVNGRYFFHFGRDVDTAIGPSFIGHVDPGDVASFAVGMGFGINEEASFSLGYDHSFVFSTETEINGVDAESTDLDIGSLSLGFSYTLSPMYSLNFNVKAGVTADAPDVQMILRLPIRF